MLYGHVHEFRCVNVCVCGATVCPPYTQHYRYQHKFTMDNQDQPTIQMLTFDHICLTSFIADDSRDGRGLLQVASES